LFGFVWFCLFVLFALSEMCSLFRQAEDEQHSEDDRLLRGGIADGSGAGLPCGAGGEGSGDWSLLRNLQPVCALRHLDLAHRLAPAERAGLQRTSVQLASLTELGRALRTNVFARAQHVSGGSERAIQRESNYPLPFLPFLLCERFHIKRAFFLLLVREREREKTKPPRI